MLIRGDARALPLADGVAHCCVTSPPYWGLRDYGAPGQIGLEPTPEAYVAQLVAVFREVRRVLRDDGTLWLNLGDSYGGAIVAPGSAKQASNRGASTALGFIKRVALKNLVGIPWRVAFALQADGWYLRADIIWHKPNPMPESVTDRPTKAHEYLFLLAKSARYYYDAAAINEPAISAGPRGGNLLNETAKGPNGGRPRWRGQRALDWAIVGRNRRSVWSVATLAYAGAHFATFPESLITPCILASAPLGGLVLDPFIGSGTVGAAAERWGRRWVGVDLTYQDLAKERTRQRGLPFEASL